MQEIIIRVFYFLDLFILTKYFTKVKENIHQEYKNLKKLCEYYKINNLNIFVSEFDRIQEKHKKLLKQYFI